MGRSLVCGKLSNTKTNAALHKFPRNEALCTQCIKEIGREGWKPTDSSISSSDHFPEDSIVVHCNRKRLKPGSVLTILPKKSRCEPQRNILRESNGRDNNDVLTTFATIEEVLEPIIVVESNHSPITSNQTLSKDFSSPCTSKTADVREKCQLVPLHDEVLHDHCYHNTPRSTMKKFDNIQRRLQSTMQENRLLKQQVTQLREKELQRPKRVIKRPKKYLTASSEDESLTKRWITVVEEVDDLGGSLLDMEVEEPESAPPTPRPRSLAPVQPCSPPSSPLTTETIIMQMWECMQQSAERENRYIENQERLLRKQEQLQESVARLDEKLDGLRRIATAEEQWERPNNLPLRSIEEVDRFESCPADEYDSVVRYLAQLGGHSLKQMVNACFKEILSDTVAASHTWSGAHGTRPLYRTRIIYAIYAAAKRSKEFTTTKREFGKTARLALKAAKQRFRQRPARVVPPIPAKRIRKTEIINRTIEVMVQGTEGSTYPLKYEY